MCATGSSKALRVLCSNSLINLDRSRYGLWKQTIIVVLPVRLVVDCNRVVSGYGFGLSEN